MKKILVLEDEASIRGFIVINLRRAGYDVIEAETGEEALERLRANPDTKVALLDIMLPGIDGFEVCRRIRATNTKIGIIMLTARSQEMDKVTGLMTGADDYVTKPFSPAELTARVDALFRRAGGEETAQTGEISQPPFLLNTRNRTLEKNGQRVKLTQVEYAIMRVFMENPGKALSREEILDRVWGRDYFGELKIVDVNIRRLRLKIEDLVTPTHFADAVLEALGEESWPVPVVWNCGGYESVETLGRLEGRVQVYLPDFKYALTEPARDYSAAADYPEIAKAAILEMFRQTGPYRLENGLLKRGVLIRHLVLPGELGNTKAVIDWVAETFRPGDVLFSLMSQYTPQPGAEGKLARRLTRAEYRAAERYMADCGLTDGFTQERTSAKEEYTPDFHLQGI